MKVLKNRFTIPNLKKNSRILRKIFIMNITIKPTDDLDPKMVG